jgi:hypothetical protein
MPGHILFLLVSVIVWTVIKVSARRAIVYVMVEVAVRSMEYVLFFLFGFMTTFWVIGIAEEKGWIDGGEDEVTIPSTHEGGILSEPEEDEEGSLDLESEGDSYQSDGHHMSKSPRAYTWIRNDLKQQGRVMKYL